jgi:hypothetical protein
MLARHRERVVPVSGQETKLGSVGAEVHEQVAGLLGHPRFGWGSQSRPVYAAAVVLDHDEQVEAA